MAIGVESGPIRAQPFSYFSPFSTEEDSEEEY